MLSILSSDDLSASLCGGFSPGGLSIFSVGLTSIGVFSYAIALSLDDSIVGLLKTVSRVGLESEVFILSRLIHVPLSVA